VTFSSPEKHLFLEDLVIEIGDDNCGYVEFRVTHSHRFPMTEAPEPESRLSQVVAQEDTFFSAIVMRKLPDLQKSSQVSDRCLGA
jgi:hypothetical protein